jgi:hypothetical protein
MERWGVFSVIDHKNDLSLATELLLYDKIAVPTPMDRDGDDWNRWQGNNWEPDKLMTMVERLKPPRLVIETDWNLDRQKNWRKSFEEAKAEIDKVSAEIQTGIDKRVAEAERATTGRSKEERDKAVQAAAWAETRNEIIRHLKGQVEIHFGPVEFYAAYQSKVDFEQLHPDEDAVKQDVERVNFLIQHRLAVPDEAPQILLDRVIELAMTPTFKDRRRLFYDWQISLLEERHHKPEQILIELEQLVRDFNAQALANDQKCRWETVITVLTVSGAALAALVGFDPSALSAMTHVPDAARYAALAGGLNTAGIAVWRKLQSRKEVDAPHRIAAPGAMFHQMGADTGFEFRTRRSDGQDRRPQRF